MNIKVKKKRMINSAKDKLTKSNITAKYIFYNLNRSIFCGKCCGNNKLYIFITTYFTDF